MRRIAIILLAFLPCAGCTFPGLMRDSLFSFLGDSYSGGTTRVDKKEHFTYGMAQANADRTTGRPQSDWGTPAGTLPNN